MRNLVRMILGVSTESVGGEGGKGEFGLILVH